MVQKLIIGGLAGTGVIGVLIVAGFVTWKFVSTTLGTLALSGGVLIAILLGILGVIGVAKRVL
jgi:hypothetical protein